MNDKELYGFILSNYQIFAKSLESIKKEFNPPIKKKFCDLDFKYTLTKQGVKKFFLSIFSDTPFDDDYFVFSTVSVQIIEQITKNGIIVYQMSGSVDCKEYICHIFNLEMLLKNFSRHIFDIKAVDKHRHFVIPNTLFDYYVETIKTFLNFGREKGWWCHDVFPSYYRGENIFYSNALYKYIEWNFETIEKYKHQINWKLVFPCVEWTEADLNKYKSFIPFKYKNEDGGRYDNDIIRERFVVSWFYNVGYLSNQFIEENYINDNINEINKWTFLQSAYFIWTGEELQYFFKLFCSNNDSKSQTSDVREFWHNLINNRRFIWTIDLLKAAIDLRGYNYFLDTYYLPFLPWNPELLKDVIDLERDNDNFYKKFLHNDTPSGYLPLFEELFKKYTNTRIPIDKDLFLCKLAEGNRVVQDIHRRIQVDAYSIYFTEDNILKSSIKWDEIVATISCGSRRTSSDYYKIYKAKTMWDCFNDNEHIVLTYDLCKFLTQIYVVIGERYEIDGWQIRPDSSVHVTKKVNALDLFATHKIASDDDIKKILEDDELTLKLLITHKNQSIIDYLLKRFFQNYSPMEFFETLDKFKQLNTDIK